jgi:hypothetical protein
LHCLQDERRVGGGILRLEGIQLLEVAGVGYYGGELFERVELVHKGTALRPKLKRNLKSGPRKA